MFDNIVNICSCLEIGDGVGNIVRDYSIILSENNIKNCILYEYLNPKYQTPELCLYHVDTLNEHITSRTLVIYHKSNYSDISSRIIELKCAKILLWYNMTPPEFFKPYNTSMFDLAKRSIREVASLAPFFPYSWGNSDYNCDDLRKMGYKKADTLHFPYDFSRFTRNLTSTKIEKKKNEINILFVGRLAPNKRQEDIIRAFYYYHKLNPDSRLTLVGHHTIFDNYKQELQQLAKSLSLPVYFTGKISLYELITYYKTADLFLCMSEHEGLNIPLLEAMYFEVPIIAFNSSSIAEGMGNAGIIFHQKNFPYVAHLINFVLNDSTLIESMKDSGKQRVRHFDKKYCENRLISLIKNYADELNI